MQILLLAALSEEAEAFLPGEGIITDAGWPHVRRVSALGHDLRIATTGIGKVNIAAAAAMLHAAEPADLFAIIGTAGKIGVARGDCFWLAHAVQHDYGAERPGSFVHYTPGAWPLGPASVEPFTALPDPGSGLPAVTIASGDAFVECPAQSAFLAERLGAALVDMETGALGQFARQVARPWIGIKATTDEANQDSAADFHTNLRIASNRSARAMEQVLSALGVAIS